MTILYLEQPQLLLDGTYIICGGDNDGEISIEFTSSNDAWAYYFKHKPE
tara:strand:+ start:11006 stop:11152 length:147 start_codon:yes stop_codon:yes gene_type:complete